MKKILFSLVAAFLIIGASQNKTPIKSEANTSYHTMTDMTLDINYSKVLNAGYYLLVNENVTFTSDMFLGDVESYNDYMNIADVIESYVEEIYIETEYWSPIHEMISEFDDYHSITENNASWITNISMLRVDSFAVFDPNPTKEIKHFEMFYVPTTPVSTDAKIAGGKTHLVNIDTPTSLDEIKSRYTASDSVDGDITENLQFKSDYSLDNLAPRSYYILSYVTDSAGHTAYAADIILVKDVTNPTTTLSQTEIVIEVGTVYTIEDAKRLFSFSDNFSTGEKLKTYILDFYKDSYNKVGEYTVEARCQDEAGNYSEYVRLIIKVVDTEAPDIYLINNSNKLVANHQLTPEEIKNHFRIEDNYYNIPSTSIEIVSNSCNGTEGVDFNLTVAVTDGSGNRCEKTFLYYLSDTQAPVINVSNTIYIQEGTTLTNAQFLELLKEVGAVGTDAVSLSITDEETNENKTTISYTVTYSDGTVKSDKVILEYYPKPTQSSSDHSYLVGIIGLLVLAAIGCGSIVLAKKKD